MKGQKMKQVTFLLYLCSTLFCFFSCDKTGDSIVSNEEGLTKSMFDYSA